MITLKKMLESANKNAFKEIAALQKLIAIFGDDVFCVTYSGTAFAESKTSNAYKLRKMYESKGFEILGEAIGARHKLPAAGHIVYVALRQVQLAA